MSQSKKPKRILILALSGIGNFVMQSPVFAAIKNKYPDSHITVWVAPRGTKVLAENNPHIDIVIEAPIKQSVFKHLSLTWQLAKSRYDIGIVLSPGQLWKSAAYLFLAGIPIRIGNTYKYIQNSNSKFLLTNAIPELPNLHDIEQNMRLLEPLGIHIPNELIHYQIHIADSTENVAEKLLANLQIPADKKIIGIHPGSAPDFLWKRWLLENFITLCENLTKKYNAHILIFGGPDEEEQKNILKEALGSDATVISEDLPVTAAIMKRCVLVLSNDSGLMHIAAAVNVPTFGLFGPTDEKQTGPRGKNSFVIRAPHTSPIYDTENNFDLGNQPHETMKAITPEFVLNQLASMLS